MSTPGETPLGDPRSDEIETFWVDARIHANLNRLAAYWGPKPLDVLLPPASAWGGTAEVADELAALVVSGVKTATSSAVWEYESLGEPLPSVGDLEIVLDGGGHPRALIATTEVAVVPFDEVDAAFARLEGEGDRSLESWRTAHRAFFTEHAELGRDFHDRMPVVCQRFDLLYP